MLAKIIFCVGFLFSTISQADTLILSSAAEDKVTFIDLQTGELIARRDSPDGPHEVEVSPDGSMVAISSYGTNKIHLFDVQTTQPMGFINLGENTRPHGIAWLNNDTLTVTTEGSNQLVFANVKTMSVETVVSTEQNGGHQVYPTPDGKTLMVPNMGSDSVSAFDVKTRKLTTIIPAGKRAQGATFSNNGRLMWVTNSREGNISVIDIASQKTITKIPTGNNSARIWITPDEKFAVVTNYISDTLSVIDVDTLTPYKTITFPEHGTDAGPVYLLPIDEGKKLLVGLITPDEIAILDTQSWEIVGKIETYGEIDGMDISKN